MDKMSRVNSRIRTDVRNGDLVSKNKRGWYTPMTLEDITPDKILKVYQDGQIRDLTSEEWTRIGRPATPITPQPEERDFSLVPYVLLGVLLGLGLVALLLL